MPKRKLPEDQHKRRKWSKNEMDDALHRLRTTNVSVTDLSNETGIAYSTLQAKFK